VQIKVTIFNAMFAGFLFGGLASGKGRMRGLAALSAFAISAAGVAWLALGLLSAQPTSDIALLIRQFQAVPGDIVIPHALPTNALSVASVLVGFVIGMFFFGRNFFQYSFEKTFHFTEEGWSNFTFSFAWFFVLTAVLNELVRQTFVDTQIYDVLGYKMDGVNVWIAFKLVIIMPLSGVFAWYLTRILQHHRMPDDHVVAGSSQLTDVARAPALSTAKVRAAE
jgi:intracellular septation protein A